MYNEINIKINEDSIVVLRCIKKELMWVSGSREKNDEYGT
jgi:hypothetical protein